MTGKDMRVGGDTTDAQQATKRAKLRAILSWGLGAAAVIGITAGMNQFWKPNAVSAQAPANSAPRTGTAQPGATQPGAFRPAPAAKTAPRGAVAPASGSVADSPRVAPAAPTTSKANAAPPGKAAPAGAADSANRPNAVANPDLKVVAVVNGEQMTRQDLARECVRRYGKEVLESMVNKHLILQACQQRNITITQQDVEDEIERIAGKFKLSVEQWMKLLQEERNVSPSEYRREIIWPTLALRTLTANDIQVTNDELQEAFESEFGPQVRVRLIAVETKKKADDAHKRVTASPADFANAAKDLSEDPSASIMGLIPPIRRHVGDPELERVAFSLKPGQISPVIKVANQYVILKCEEHLRERNLGGDELRREREKLTDRIQSQKMRAASGDYFKKLQQQAKVVNVLNDAELQKKNPGVAALINNQPITMRQLQEECIQRHGLSVIDGEINRLILQQELKRRNTSVSDEDIQWEVGRAAESYGYVTADGKPDVEKWLEHVTKNDGGSVDLYVRDAVWPSAALKKLVGNTAAVTEEDLRKGFEANFGERVEVLAIVLSNQRQAQQVWEQARDNPTDSFFGELAHQYSIEPASRANYGKVPPLRRHGGQPLLEDQAFALKPGELSSIVAVGDKFIILRCLGRTKPVVPEMSAEVRQELERDLTEKKLRTAMATEFDRLKEIATYDNFLAQTSHRGKTAAAKGAPGKSAASAKPAAGAAKPATGTGTAKPATTTATRPAAPAANSKVAPAGATAPAGRVVPAAGGK